jgi:hypothetical protein
MQIWIGDKAFEKFNTYSFEDLGALSDGIEALPSAKGPIVRDSGWKKSRARIRVRDEHPGFEKLEVFSLFWVKNT